MILKILSNNTVISEHELSIGREYLVGRSQECDIILNTKNGISRKHLKLTVNDDETLTIELLSKLGELHYNSDSVEELTVPYGERFSITQFEFIYEKAEEVFEEDVNLNPAEAEQNSIGTGDFGLPDNSPELNLDGFASPQTDQAQDLKLTQEQDTEPELDDEEENTLTATNKLSVILNIMSKSTGKVKKSYELEGNNWIIGRDDKCSLKLSYKFISRKHFELVKTNEGFYIFDFGSANGTSVNGKKLPKKEHIRIYNDDIIDIKTLKIKIELKDETFKDKIKHIEIEETNDFEYNKPLNVEQFSNDDFFVPNQKVTKKSNPMKSIMRAMIALIIIGSGYFYMNQEKTKKRKVASVKTKKTQPKKKIVEANENQTLISDSFNTAQNYYTEKNHILCINELERLHKLVPAYKNSKQLANLCQQGLEIEEEQRNRRERELQAKKVEENANKIAQSCKDNFSQYKSKMELDNCLSQLIVLNPGHPIILQLQQKWDDIETKKQESLKSKLAYQKQINAGEAIIKRAKSQKNGGQLKKSIKSFNAFLSRNYPNKSKYSELAKREIASMQSTLQSQMKNLLSSCESNHNSGNSKETVYSCEKFLKKYPDNEKASEYRYQALNKLRGKARKIYSDGNLEESLGNIPAAKEKWNEILKFHVKSDEYYKKAQRKLKKYGDI